MLIVSLVRLLPAPCVHRIQGIIQCTIQELKLLGARVVCGQHCVQKFLSKYELITLNIRQNSAIVAV